ncbi:non-hydrolyzing UDP-N-acetylglucosamine 2-epimerase [Pseudonocardia acaciae]|uniref:non-hydrolyzing UDP-N-acetylglucosamine 2-epimerase n=1 Tax=Pseudonocardia acaciae TaxID=551276 RepID=UPI00048A77E2|nr:UDP-N-acetylglucosamine 2-epimerase (non-hydrolyzing) [Pseudonocardia acaciae]
MSVPVVHLVVGTRPEAIKMAPLAIELRRAGLLRPVLVATGQHPAMVGQALAAFGYVPDAVCRLERASGEQAELVAQLAPKLDTVLARGSAAVVAQGDTTSALVGGLVAFWRRLPLVHLEAGLRSGDLAAPFPEEANRRLLGVLADLHLAPTRRAVRALLAEGVPAERIMLVGNTVVDAALRVAAGARPPRDPRLVEVDREVGAGRARLMLVTAHRRESWGPPLDRILAAVDAIVRARGDVRCVLPAHPNPAVREQVERALAGTPRTVVTDPLPYPELCYQLARAALVLSDSGGIQEEAPSFGVPVLVLREVTERMEAVQAGWARLVGSDTDRLVAEALGVLDGATRRPAAGNPFGDGRAGARGAQAIAALLGLAPAPELFEPDRPVMSTAS